MPPAAGKDACTLCGVHSVLRSSIESLKQISIYMSKLQDCNSTVKFPLQDKNCCRGHCLQVFSFLVHSRKTKNVTALKITRCLRIHLHAPISSVLLAGVSIQMCAATGSLCTHVQAVTVLNSTRFVGRSPTEVHYNEGLPLFHSRLKAEDTQATAQLSPTVVLWGPQQKTATLRNPSGKMGASLAQGHENLRIVFWAVLHHSPECWQ